MSRVLVTGATGFVGRPTVVALVRAGHEVHAVGRRTPDRRSADVRWHDVDLLADGSGAARLLATCRAEVLVHLAWYTEHGRFWTAPENLDWVRATLQLLREFARTDCGRRVVMAGTCAEYEWNRAVYTEHDPCAPRTLYGAAKHGLHLIAESFAALEGISFAWARLFFLYGPGEPPARFVPCIARQLLGREPARMTAGAQVRDFLHVTDAGSALGALATSELEGAVNIASGSGVSLFDLAQLIAEHTGGLEHLQVGVIASHPDEPPSLIANVTRLRQAVGWQPTIPLGEGIADSVARQRGG